MHNVPFEGQSEGPLIRHRCGVRQAVTQGLEKSQTSWNLEFCSIIQFHNVVSQAEVALSEVNEAMLKR